MLYKLIVQMTPLGFQSPVKNKGKANSNSKPRHLTQIELIIIPLRSLTDDTLQLLICSLYCISYLSQVTSEYIG